jgi:hypothetical protein
VIDISRGIGQVNVQPDRLRGGSSAKQVEENRNSEAPKTQEKRAHQTSHTQQTSRLKEGREDIQEIQPQRQRRGLPSAVEKRPGRRLMKDGLSS